MGKPNKPDKREDESSHPADLFMKRISRRDFLIKGGLAVLGTAAAGIGINYLMNKKNPVSGRFNGFTLDNSSAATNSNLILSDWKWSTEARYYKKLSGGDVQCELCPNGCRIAPGGKGNCRVRKNEGGKLFSMSYGNPAAVHVDPIEKKPLNHFLPGTWAFSMGFAGCNFHCLNCQNSDISQTDPEDFRDRYADEAASPKTIAKAAIENGCRSVAYTYNEPTTFFEYMIDCAKEARSSGLKNVWVTCGYINRKPLLELCRYIDAANVDLKSFDDTIYQKLNSGRLEPVLDTLKTLKEQGVWFEITNLVVPTYTDNEEMIREMARWIVKELGTEYPLHFSRFHPQFKLQHLAMTSIEFLEKAKEIAQEEGLKHVYIGNVAQNQMTYCSDKTVCIERAGYRIIKNSVGNDGVCSDCGEKIAGVWD